MLDLAEPIVKGVNVQSPKITYALLSWFKHKHQMFRRSKLLCVKRCLTPHSRQLFQPHPHLKRSRCSRHFWTIFRQFQKAKKILFLQNLSKFMLTSKTSTLLLGACH
ncbi:uncharacterized protein LOC119553225 isoform X10 [Drosophila subpulchrella]|uniref:uncharacterized protein LOC119553225 isoform X10 n=1 Tax=Drosophila subpulchrella TaxID=1486046 RepID=UPI0018A16C73|nr:uncharacterized protein LOC119553225 isoform X10 [Drosophila subpulchrella]